MSTQINSYNCMVRPAGQITHEVPKIGICAKEIILLRMIHGADAIHKIELMGKFEHYDDQAVLGNLAHTYGKQLVEKVFNTVLFDFEEDDDTGKKYISLKVIENEATQAASVSDILREAGPVRNIPVKTEGSFHVAGPEMDDDRPSIE